MSSRLLKIWRNCSGSIVFVYNIRTGQFVQRADRDKRPMSHADLILKLVRSDKLPDPNWQRYLVRGYYTPSLDNLRVYPLESNTGRTYRPPESVVAEIKRKLGLKDEPNLDIIERNSLKERVLHKLGKGV